jgi:molybdate transport system ATP-binding protein
VGYVFQEPSLFEHLDVRGNLRFAQARSGAAQDYAALGEVIALLGIEALLERRPAALSGGERQRVAIARALASRPRVLLLDEPLASIDPSRRREILPWLERLHDELRTPMLYVTHAADEMARLADQLVVLERGRVIASGPVAEVLASTEGHASMGEEAGALLDGVITAHDAAWALARVDFDGGQVWMRDNGLPLGHRVRLRVLARDASIATAEPRHTSIQNQLRGQVEAITPGAHPAQALVRVRCGGSTVLARLTRRAVDSLGLQPGHSVWVQVKSVAIIE